VEEEFLVVDRTTRALAPCSDKLVSAARPTMGESVSPELNLCQIETASVVCSTTDELRADLVKTRGDLGRAAASIGCAIAATGTHPFSSWEDQRVNAGIARYHEMEERYQVVARQQVICGCHVHVGIDDPELAIDVMNRSRPWLPTLLALSANSPFWHGVDTGFASYRTQVWQRWPTSGMPPTMPDRAAYDSLIHELETIDAIQDATYVYWYVRPSARYPTVEFRPCDVCLDVEDTVAIAALVRALAWACARDALAGAPSVTRSSETMNASIWRAARYGIEGELVDARAMTTQPAQDAIHALLTYAAEGLEAHGDAQLVRDQIGTILGRGNGAIGQRRAHARADGDAVAVVDHLIERTTVL
jgi:glutamate---cysteine ligase / carboxylate-amine ligase